MPSLAKQAHKVLDRMDFGYYYNPAENQIRGGFWLGTRRRPGGSRCRATTAAASPVYYTGHHYGAFNTEPRMASYLGIAAEQIPQKHYFGTFRTFHSENCDYVVDRAGGGRALRDLPRRSGCSRAPTSTAA